MHYYVNHLREKYSAKEVLKLSKEESRKLGAEVAQVCKIPELIIINIPKLNPKRRYLTNTLQSDELSLPLKFY
ncbi:MAG: hypothetical protein CM1200mP28_12840 [Deltaproteobacteria bacterium]|nr:MAG: hypothetical protein CM1200mP28_12840 [Deltaproteobacteria bacterium]